MSNRGRSTQSIANAFPPWSDIRKDEQSLGFQFLNVAGLRMDDLRKQLQGVVDNFFLPSARINDIDCYFSYNLPGNFTFEKEEGDTTFFQYTPPTVSGQIDSTYYPVDISEKNNVESFWYDAIPTRISLGDSVDAPCLVASGYASQSPLLPLLTSGILDLPNRLQVKCEGGSSYLDIGDNNFLRQGLVQVHGTTRAGDDIIEEMNVLHDGTYQTSHEFQTVGPIYLYGMEDPEETFVTITAGSFREEDYAPAFSFDSNENGDPIEQFWALGSGLLTDQRTLDIKKYETDDFLLRLDGFTDKYILLQQELRDQANTNIQAEDLAVEPMSDRLWLVSSDTLYLFEGFLPYGDMSKLDGKQYNASSIIEPSSYYAVRGDTIELDYIWRRPIQGLQKHRAWVEKPDGNKYSLEDGSEVTYHTDNSSWRFGEPDNRALRPAEFYVLDQTGDYIFSLEVLYLDETRSLDRRIVSVLTLQPLAEFSLTSLGLSGIQGVDIDSEGKLWVMDDSNIRYHINLHYDVMLIDFAKKIIYFREPYNKVKVF